MIDSLDRPRELFRRLPPTLRKTLGQLRFERIILDVHNPGKEFIGPAQPGNRGGTPATRVDVDDLVITTEQRSDLNMSAIADLVITAAQTQTVMPRREHGQDLTVWEIATYS